MATLEVLYVLLAVCSAAGGMVSEPVRVGFMVSVYLRICLMTPAPPAPTEYDIWVDSERESTSKSAGAGNCTTAPSGALDTTTSRRKVSSRPTLVRSAAM